MREAALNASTHQEPVQKAVAFHEQRVEEIVDGDHELDDREPQLVAHMIPEGYPSGGSLAAGENIDEQIPHFEGRSAWREQHEHGQITTRAAKSGETEAYNLRTPVSGIETVSAGEIWERGDHNLFVASSTEAKLAATANWAQEQFGEEYESDWMTVLVTLIGVRGEQVRIPDNVRMSVSVSEAVFESDRIDPRPVKVPLESCTPAETYNKLSPLFDRLWADTGLEGSVFYSDGSEAEREIRGFLG
ncbi:MULTISPECIES: hypothetical protein [Halolamina]|uniref:Uncharacterized protein n=2 Tax=Halolamina TaxID=1075397 RepID=A0A1I5VQ66_9EURY|nr:MULTISPECIES: hypothetical protein [Halolamina]NHX37828.1 hypothetical protein [Halolamina sp. R1-12]SFQ09581.1 hypothetical protein SAMN05216277_11925 [Halolamina pelagica]